jgi:hypothetical protein
MKEIQYQILKTRGSKGPPFDPGSLQRFDLDYDLSEEDKKKLAEVRIDWEPLQPPFTGNAEECAEYMRKNTKRPRQGTAEQEIAEQETAEYMPHDDKPKREPGGRGPKK